MQQDTRLYALVARKLAGEATGAELRELKELLGEHFEHEYIYEMLSAYWKQEPDALSPDDDNSQEVFDRIISSVVHAPELLPEPEMQDEFAGNPLFMPVRRRPWQKWMYAAAIITLGGA